jgi:hypothetical protein
LARLSPDTDLPPGTHRARGQLSLVVSGSVEVERAVLEVGQGRRPLGVVHVLIKLACSPNPDTAYTDRPWGRPVLEAVRGVRESLSHTRGDHALPVARVAGWRTSLGRVLTDAAVSAPELWQVWFAPGSWWESNVRLERVLVRGHRRVGRAGRGGPGGVGCARAAGVAVMDAATAVRAGRQVMTTVARRTRHECFRAAEGGGPVAGVSGDAAASRVRDAEANLNTARSDLPTRGRFTAFSTRMNRPPITRKPDRPS